MISVVSLGIGVFASSCFFVFSDSKAVKVSALALGVFSVLGYAWSFAEKNQPPNRVSDPDPVSIVSMSNSASMVLWKNCPQLESIILSVRAQAAKAFRFDPKEVRCSREIVLIKKGTESQVFIRTLHSDSREKSFAPSAKEVAYVDMVSRKKYTIGGIAIETLEGMINNQCKKGVEYGVIAIKELYKNSGEVYRLALVEGESDGGFKFSLMYKDKNQEIEQNGPLLISASIAGVAAVAALYFW